MLNETDTTVKNSDQVMKPPLPVSPPPSLTIPPPPEVSTEVETLLDERSSSKRRFFACNETGDEEERKKMRTEEDTGKISPLPSNCIDKTEKTNMPARNEKIPLDRELETERKVIIMKGSLPNLALPDGWIALNHRSGGLIYLHRPTRVCTWSRPYFIGGGSVRKHDVPLAAIPCFHQKKALLTEQVDGVEQENGNSAVHRSDKGASVLNALNMVQNNTDIGEAPNSKADTELDNDALSTTSFSAVICLSSTDGVTEENSVTDEESMKEENSLTRGNNLTEENSVTQRSNVTKQSGAGKETASFNLRETQIGSGSRNSSDKQPAQSKTKSAIDVVDSDELGHYLSNLWEFESLSSKQEQNAIKLTTPEVVHEVELPASLECLPYLVKGVDKQQNKGWALHTDGKTPVAILHEYCQRVLKEKPTYLLSECDNPESPFIAEVEISGIKYGSGSAASKKVARQIAAETTLEILMPGNFRKIRDCQISQEEVEFFDKVDILDPRIFDFCSKTGLPIPSQLLEECLKRNQGVCTSPIQFTTVCGQDKNLSFQITCGKHTARGPCKNKRIGRQLASQAILKKLHPHLEKWGALIRIYCDRPTGSIKKYKRDDDDDTFENKDGRDSDTLPNKDMLESLKQEMRRLHAKVKETEATNNEENSTKLVFTVDF